VAERATPRRSSIFVLAGCNGAGKSSVGGAALRQSGADYFNPDEAAFQIALANERHSPRLTQEDVNAAAWSEGVRLLTRAIDERVGLAFETTLGGNTITELLARAANRGIDVNVWFVGLATVRLHIERVRRRVAKGGHDIPEARIRERYQRGRENLIRLLPRLAALRLFDNSTEADPDRGIAPVPALLLDYRRGRIAAPRELRALMSDTPQWAKPIVATALKLHLRGPSGPP
jgi:predicted ABC-type ATPase